jgi:hypothetical protein
MIYEARPNVIHFSKEESGWQARYSLTSMSMADLMEYREKRKQREASSSQTPNLRQWYRISEGGAKDSRSNLLQGGEDDVIQDHTNFEGPDLWVSLE